MKVILETRREH